MKKIVLTLLTLCALAIGTKAYAASCMTACDVNLRKEPKDDARIVYTAKEGERFEIVERSDEWLCVRIGEDELAYVRTFLVMTEDDRSAKHVRAEREETPETEAEDVRIVDESDPSEEDAEQAYTEEKKDETVSEEPRDGELRFTSENGEEVGVGAVFPIDTYADNGVDYSVLGGQVEYDYYSRSLDDYVRDQMTSGRVTRYSQAVGDWVALDYNDEEDRAYVRYYMDPKNFIEDPVRRMMFMKLDYADVDVSLLNRMLQNKGVLDGKGSVFKKAAREANIHPVYLVAHALLETGNGRSKLATGKLTADGKPTYNMFGIGASDDNPLFKGAARAYREGWFSVDSAITGGANFVSAAYINHPRYRQNTLYSMRYRMNGPDLWHQYATDARWAHSQSQTIYNYMRGIPSSELRYRVPVFMEAQ